jgi:hypothetical protein
MKTQRIPEPRIVTYHLASAAATIVFRVERALGLAWLIGSWKWRLVALADASYPPEDRRRNGLPAESEP